MNALKVKIFTLLLFYTIPALATGYDFPILQMNSAVIVSFIASLFIVKKGKRRNVIITWLMLICIGVIGIMTANGPDAIIISNLLPCSILIVALISRFNA